MTHACPGPVAALPAMQITARPPVLCPVCFGKQRVPADFYPINQGESALNADFIPCRTCNGKGVV